MEIKQSEFVISAVNPEQYPADNKPEIAFVGRSNVGKSSLINALANRKKLVKVSSTPGKTRLINFFIMNNEFYFVDLPGYGYAKVSKKEKQNWGKTIEKYLVGRKQLKKIILIVDCRHAPTEDDKDMYKFIKNFGYDCTIVATKIDKLTRNQLNKNLSMLRKELDIAEEDRLLAFSSLNKKGKEELLEDIGKTVTEAQEN